MDHDWLGKTLYPQPFEARILFVDILGKECNARRPGMVEVRIGSTFGLGLFPLNQIDARRPRIITEREEGRAPDTVWDTEPFVIGRVRTLTNIEYYLETDVL